MTHKEIEALVTDYARRAEKFAQRHGCRLDEYDVRFGEHGWCAWFECRYHDGRCAGCGAYERRTPRAALRAAYRILCKEIRDE